MPWPPLVAPVGALTQPERERTVRHAVLSGFGDLGQRRLAAAHVAIVGAGGLGSPAILALSAAGVGRLTVIDDDVADASNLQRQVIHRVGDVGSPKVDSAVRVASELSPTTILTPIAERITADNAVELLRGADVVLDGTDTFASRTVVASACETLGIPLVWAAVQEFHAQITVFCSSPPAGLAPIVLSDLYPPESVGDVPTCADAGVLGSLTLEAGAIMATEAIKLIAGVGEPLFGRVLVIDGLHARRTEVPLVGSAAPKVAQAPKAPATAIPGPIPELTASEMLAAQEAGAVLLDVREPFETASGVVAGSIVIPLQEFMSDPGSFTDETDSAPVVVICAHGVRASRAAQVLQGRGVEASILVGGLAAWA